MSAKQDTLWISFTRLPCNCHLRSYKFRGFGNFFNISFCAVSSICTFLSANFSTYSLLVPSSDASWPLVLWFCGSHFRLPKSWLLFIPFVYLFADSWWMRICSPMYWPPQRYQIVPSLCRKINLNHLLGLVQCDGARLYPCHIWFFHFVTLFSILIICGQTTTPFFQTNLLLGSLAHMWRRGKTWTFRFEHPPYIFAVRVKSMWEHRLSGK